MIKGIGCDLIELDRIAKVYNRHGVNFLKRIYTDSEVAYCLSHKNPIPALAARFAAKEAAAKAFGTGIGTAFTWHDSFVYNNTEGKPLLLFSEKCQNYFGKHIVHLSLSHSHSHAMAMVILETT